MAPRIQERDQRLSDVEAVEQGGPHAYPRELGASNRTADSRRRISREIAMFKRGRARAVELLDVDAAARGARLRRILVTADLAALVMAAAVGSLVVEGFGMALATNDLLLTLAVLSPIFFVLA